MEQVSIFNEKTVKNTEINTTYTYKYITGEKPKVISISKFGDDGKLVASASFQPAYGTLSVSFTPLQEAPNATYLDVIYANCMEILTEFETSVVGG